MTKPHKNNAPVSKHQLCTQLSFRVIWKLKSSCQMVPPEILVNGLRQSQSISLFYLLGMSQKSSHS